MYIGIPALPATPQAMIYLLHPCLSAADGEEARAFMSVVREELQVATLSELKTVDNVLDTEPTAADGVIFVNPPRADVASEVEELLERATNAGAVVLPVALDEAGRRPPGAVAERQSFDVVDHRRRRGLTADQRGTLARAFAREALSRLQPTFTKDRLRLFLCHRRLDGEGLVARVGAKLDVLHAGHVFRDLVDVQVGEEAQQRIDDALASTDVVIFFDTPRAGESWWIAKELAGALGRNIPVVWVRLGPDDGGRLDLPVQPGAPAPHIRVADPNRDDGAVRDLADEILETAFALARTHVRASQEAIRALRRWAKANDAQLETLDARRLIYELTRPVADRPYPTRPSTDVVQLYARHPTDEDLNALNEFLTQSDMGPHPRNCRSFDAAVLLDPTATTRRAVGEWSVVEHPERFLASLPITALAPAAARSPRLLVLGAFPNGDLASLEVDGALHAATTTWLRLGGSIVFGGHPTFTPLIIEAARLMVPGAERDRVTVFQSEWYVAPDSVEELSAQVTVRTVPRAADRAASLTAMRMAMIQPGSAEAVVAIGGLTDEGRTHTPGIDEEVRLARLAGLQVYLFGATGGRTAELALAAAAEPHPFASLGNRLSANANAELAMTDDYAEAVRTIWSSVA
jgi:hypothetical protein